MWYNALFCLKTWYPGLYGPSCRLWHRAACLLHAAYGNVLCCAVLYSMRCVSLQALHVALQRQVLEGGMLHVLIH